MPQVNNMKLESCNELILYYANQSHMYQNFVLVTLRRCSNHHFKQLLLNNSFDDSPKNKRM